MGAALRMELPKRTAVPTPTLSESASPAIVMSNKPYRRKKKLVKSRLQLHLVAIFSSLACLSALFQVLVLNRSILVLAERTGESASRIASEIPSVLFGNLVITIAVLLPLMLVVGILVTHRVAGPIYRFEQHLGAIARGENPGVCKIRKGDELQELCTIINDAVEAMRSKASETVDAVETTKDVDAHGDDRDSGNEETQHAAAA